MREEKTKQAPLWATERKTYTSWVCLNRRCFDTKHHKYKKYGKRGIQVCERWKNFENFFADMGNRPEGKTIDRINNDGNYEPNNCKWSTRKEQQNNKSNNVFLTYKGETKTIAQWGNKLNINYDTLYQRIRNKWDTKKALTY